MLRASRGDGNKCCGTPVGMERYFTGFPQECITVFDFYGASASTKCIHCPLLSYAKRWVLNYNDNANWNISSSANVENFLLIK